MCETTVAIGQNISYPGEILLMDVPVEYLNQAHLITSFKSPVGFGQNKESWREELFFTLNLHEI